MKRAILPFLAALALSNPPQALAQVGAGIPSGVGQTFFVPATATYLESIFTGGIYTGGRTNDWVLWEFFGGTFGAELLRIQNGLPQSLSLSPSNQTVPIGLNLIPGAEYLFAANRAFPQQAAFRYTAGDDLPGQTIYWLCRTPGEPAALLCPDYTSDPNDVENFAANFTTPPTHSVPEPSSYLLVLTGIMGIGLVMWRRRDQLA